MCGLRHLSDGVLHEAFWGDQQRAGEDTGPQIPSTILVQKRFYRVAGAWRSLFKNEGDPGKTVQKGEAKAPQGGTGRAETLIHPFHERIFMEIPGRPSARLTHGLTRSAGQLISRF